MKITYSEICGLKRLMKRNIHKVIYTPKQDIQVIIGSNGSGKTSLLKELSALPAKSADYHKEGYKITHIDDRNDKYILSSHFSPKQKHSFVLNGEELNLGGTYPIQKDLVKRYFRIDDKIQRMLLGRIDFTNMRGEEKKEWFTLLNPTSLSYPLQVYAKLKESHRDINGALKLHKNRLMAETAKCIDGEEEKRLSIELDTTKQLLHSLFEQKPQITQLQSQVSQSILSSTNAISRLVATYQSILKKNKGNHYSQTYLPKDKIESEKLSLTLAFQDTKRKINDSYKEISKLNELKQTLEGTNGKDLGQVEIEKLMLSKSIDELLSKLPPNVAMTNSANHADQLLNTLEQIDTPLLSLLVELPANPDKKYNSPYLTHLESVVKERSIRIECLKQDLFKFTRLVEEDEKMKEHNLTECPKCNHMWVRDYDSVGHKRRLESIALLTKQLSDETALHTDTEKELDVARSYGRLINEYRRFTQSYPQLSDFWSYLQATNVVYENPPMVSTHLREYKSILSLQSQYHIQRGKLDELNVVYQKLKDVQSENITQINTRIDALNESLYGLNATQHRLSSQLNQLNQYSEMLSSFATIQKELGECSIERASAYRDQISLIHRDMVNRIIIDTQSLIAQIETQLSRIHSQKEIVAHITKEIRTLEDKEQYLKLALQTMSPVDGLIAKGLYGFINTFIAQMNNFISKIWLTPLELMPIVANDDNEIELDYVFSARIHDGIVPDINECSKGEAEIINRAFILVAMHYLGMSGYPLYLDEFAANMDPKHKDSAFHAIVHLMGNSHFSQLFVVSHFEKFYSSLRNSDTVVFCSENVYIPESLRYNQVISFSNDTF